MAEEILTPAHAIMMASANLLGVVTVIANNSIKSRLDKRKGSDNDRRDRDPELREIKQFLFGSDGQNGMRSEMRDMKRSIERVDKRLTSLQTGIKVFIAATAPDRLKHVDFGDD